MLSKTGCDTQNGETDHQLVHQRKRRFGRLQSDPFEDRAQCGQIHGIDRRIAQAVHTREAGLHKVRRAVTVEIEELRGADVFRQEGVNLFAGHLAEPWIEVTCPRWKEEHHPRHLDPFHDLLDFPPEPRSVADPQEHDLGALHEGDDLVLPVIVGDIHARCAQFRQGFPRPADGHEGSDVPHGGSQLFFDGRGQKPLRPAGVTHHAFAVIPERAQIEYGRTRVFLHQCSGIDCCQLPDPDNERGSAKEA